MPNSAEAFPVAGVAPHHPVLEQFGGDTVVLDLDCRPRQAGFRNVVHAVPFLTTKFL